MEKKKICMVDDEADIILLCKMVLEEAGFEVELYRGRNFYKGYAATGDLTRALQATHVPTQWDSMGLEKIIYPAKSMTEEEWKEAQ